MNKIYLVVAHRGDYPEDQAQWNICFFRSPAAAHALADRITNAVRSIKEQMFFVSGKARWDHAMTVFANPENKEDLDFLRKMFYEGENWPESYFDLSEHHGAGVEEVSEGSPFEAEK